MQRVLVVTARNRRAYLLFHSTEASNRGFFVAESRDGYTFTKESARRGAIISRNGLPETIIKCHDVRITPTRSGFLVTYQRKNGPLRRKSVEFSEAGVSFHRVSHRLSVEGFPEPAVIVPAQSKKARYIIFAGTGDIHCSELKNFRETHIHQETVLEPRPGMFDAGDLLPAAARATDDGIQLLYYARQKIGGHTHYAVGSALFHKRRFGELLWRSETPLWEQPESWDGKGAVPVGVAHLNGRDIFYWYHADGSIHAVTAVSGERIVDVEMDKIPAVLARFGGNPVITPIPGNAWESKATFNPAVVYEDGKFHLLYRAIGDDDISTIGYAASEDGVHFKSRHPEPVYVPREEFEGRSPRVQTVMPNLYGSGGGSGGCEDPRIVRIGDRYVMLYVAYNGYSAPRVAMTSIAVEDFLRHQWNWSRPVLITEPGVGNKNAVIFPQKIQGKFVIMHRVFPDIVIDYVDSLDEFDGKTRWLQKKAAIAPRKLFWDSRKIGAGAPPIRTPFGWLLIYQSVGFQDMLKYKIGAMLLDLDDPHKVIARSRKPILEPRARYENEGHKYGVAYPCGAAVKDDMLYVYYGGADTVVCVATARLQQFLDALLHHREPVLTPVVV